MKGEGEAEGLGEKDGVRTFPNFGTLNGKETMPAGVLRDGKSKMSNDVCDYDGGKLKGCFFVTKFIEMVNQN